jgi:hypothetical protein
VRASTRPRPRRPLARVPAPVEERENPSDAATVLIAVGTLAVLGFVGYELLRRQNGQGPGFNLGYQLGSQIGGAAAGAVTGAANSFISQGASNDWCATIADWRKIGSPAWCAVAGFPIIPNVCFGGGDPNSWDNFRSYARAGTFVDPGPNPPSCW